nr:protein spire homolog 1-like [Chelonoidis abingdonii]
MGNGESKKLDYSSCEWRNVTKVSLGEFLRCFDQPISEEQAWALCFQCCHKMKQLAQGPYPVMIKGLGSILIHSDGAVSFMVYPKSDLNKTPQLEEQLTERLGMVIYKALDWGIDNNLERELSEPLEKLISLLLKLDTEATNPAITFQDVLKICEEHLPRPSEAASYYRTVCRVLFAEYEDLQKLMLTLQSSKESLRRMDVEDLLENDTQREKDNYWASLWHDVIRELQNGVRLRKVMEQPQHSIPPKGYACSPYELLAEDIRCKRYTLRKVKINSEQNCKSSEGNTVASQLPLKPASERKLKENSPKAPSLHDLLMIEIKQPQKLRPSSTERNGSRHKDTFVMPMFSLNSPCGNGLSVQNASTGLTIHKVQKQMLIPDLLVPEFQVCFHCHKQMVFLWPYRCHLCSSVICCDCCIKMSMPFRPCVHLPLNLIKALRLSKEEDSATQDQKSSQLLFEVEHWDCSRVPLVFEPHCLAQPLASQRETMMDWPSMDICTTCEQYLLHVLSSQQQCIPPRKRSRSWTELE